MTTFDDLTNEVHLNLLGYILDQEAITTLSAPLDASSLDLQVSDANQISTGLIEVDDELIWVSSVDTDANLIHASVRGIYGSTKAAHSTGAIVRNRPMFPRFSIKKAINDTIRSVYPDLFGVGTTEIITTAIGVGYELPAEVEEVLTVDFNDSDDTGMWFPVRRYRVKPKSATSQFPSGKAIEIYDGIAAPRSLHVVYSKVPSVLSSGTDELTATGLAESAKECIVYGACARLVGYTETARMNDDAAEARFMDQAPQGQALKAATFFYQMHLQMRAEESRRLLDRYPPRTHFVR